MEPYLSQISIFPYNRVPKGWVRCEGQVLKISENEALYSLLGNMYGGDGRTTFGLPDLRGRVPIGTPSGQEQGLAEGSESVTLTVTEIPAHTHSVGVVQDLGNRALAGGNHLAGANNDRPLYGAPESLTGLHPDSVSHTGGGSSHPNMQPYLTLCFCIATTGLYPPRT